MSRRPLILCLAGALVVVAGGARNIAALRHPAVQASQAPTSGSVLSPHEQTDGRVDGASLSISYGRPSMRGRTIFGTLVPYDQVWCPGADQCTTLSTDRDLQFVGLTLRAGEYSMWMVPTRAAWTLIINTNAHAYHTRHDSRLDVGTVALQKRALTSPVERLTFAIEPRRSGGGDIVMSWETTRVSAAFTVVR